jgi:hypothetical protein
VLPRELLCLTGFFEAKRGKYRRVIVVADSQPTDCKSHPIILSSETDLTWSQLPEAALEGILRQPQIIALRNGAMFSVVERQT